MVDTSAGQTVTVRCHGSGKESIRYHQPMIGIKEYSVRRLELTAENFEPGIYRCRCANSIQGQLNISLPVAVTGEEWGPLQVHVMVYTVMKLLYSGHLRDLACVSFRSACPQPRNNFASCTADGVFYKDILIKIIDCENVYK